MKHSIAFKDLIFISQPRHILIYDIVSAVISVKNNQINLNICSMCLYYTVDINNKLQTF